MRIVEPGGYAGSTSTVCSILATIAAIYAPWTCYETWGGIVGLVLVGYLAAVSVAWWGSRTVPFRARRIWFAVDYTAAYTGFAPVICFVFDLFYSGPEPRP